MGAPREHRRFVAIGDSLTEGMGDERPDQDPRGWADMLAARLCGLGEDLTYANLAIRGLVTHHVRERQIAPALALRPDLVGAVLGMNDLVRPGFSPERFRDDVNAVFGAFADRGATVLTATLPDVSSVIPIGRPLRGKAQTMNGIIRTAAEAHGAVLFDMWTEPATRDMANWAEDRLHPNTRGHRLMAERFLRLLGHAAEAAEPPILVPATLRLGPDELMWAVNFLAPWIYRRVTGRSSSIGRLPKRPDLLGLDVAPVLLDGTDSLIAVSGAAPRG